MKRSDDPGLSRRLGQWRGPQVPDDFNRAVWSRVEAGSALPRAIRGPWVLFEGWPSLASLAASVTLAAGVGIGVAAVAAPRVDSANPSRYELHAPGSVTGAYARMVEEERP